jgi:hypothetical protein
MKSHRQEEEEEEEEEEEDKKPNFSFSHSLSYLNAFLGSSPNTSKMTPISPPCLLYKDSSAAIIGSPVTAGVLALSEVEVAALLPCEAA